MDIRWLENSILLVTVLLLLRARQHVNTYPENLISLIVRIRPNRSNTVYMRFLRLFNSSFQVSWVRYRDTSLIAVGKFVYISDDRFKVLHERNSTDWFLAIKSVTYKDEGVYECQVNSDPYKTFKFFLSVVGKLTL